MGDARRARRNHAIVAQWVAGVRVSDLARAHHLSPSAVYLVLDLDDDLRAQRARSLAAKRRQAEAEVLAWSRDHPGESLDRCPAHGLTDRQVRAVLQGRLSAHPAPRALAARVPDSAVVEALVSFVARGDLRRSTYDRMSAAKQWPSSTTVVTRFGSWSAALRAVGASPASKPRSPGFTDAELGWWVSRFLDSAPPWTAAHFDVWRERHPKAPSSTLLRRRFGSWPSALQAARS